MSLDRLTASLASRPVSLLLMVAALGMAFLGFSVVGLEGTLLNRGTAFPSPNLWVSSPWLSLGLCAALEFVSLGLAIAINREYNIVRTGAALFPVLFLVMQGSLPPVGYTFGGGVLLLCVMLFSTAMLYGVYQRPDMSRRVFLLFVLTSVGILCQYGFAVMLPVLVVGCIQMRVMTFRTFVAMLLGLVTPLWILWGGGFMEFSSFSLPHIKLDAEMFRSSEFAFAAVTIGFTMLCGIWSGLVNLVSIYARNARTRAFHGLILVAGVVAGIGCVVDFSNTLFYVPLLNICTAYQLSLYLSLHPSRNRSVTLICVMAIYGCLFLCNLVL